MPILFDRSSSTLVTMGTYAVSKSRPCQVHSTNVGDLLSFNVYTRILGLSGVGSVVLLLRWKTSVWFPPHYLFSKSSTKRTTPFLFVILELQDEIGDVDVPRLQLWYLDNRPFIGSRNCISSLVSSMIDKGPDGTSIKHQEVACLSMELKF